MRFWRHRGRRRADRASTSTKTTAMMAMTPSARDGGDGGAREVMVSSRASGVSDDATTTRDVEEEEGDGGGAGAAFVKELREDGTLMRLERAAEALRRATMGKGGDEKTKALDAYLSRRDDEDAARKTATKTLVFLDGGDDDDDDDDDARYDSVLATLDDVSVTMRRLRLDSSSRSYSRSSDASVVENDIDAVPKTPITPKTTPVPVFTRSLAMRRLRERHSEYSTDEIVVVAKRSEETRRNRASSDSSSDSKGYTPPRRQCVATPRTSLDVLRRDTVDDGPRVSSHKSLENQLSTISSTSSSDRDSTGAANAPRKPKKKPPTPYPLTKTISARALDATTLTEKLRDALRDEPGVERQYDDVYAAALQRSLRSMSASTPTVGLCLLSRVDEIVHVIEGESTKHACFALELERSKVESMHRLSGYINAIPSKRLRDALLDMHKTALENIERQFHARMVSAQRRYLDSIVSDARVSSRTPPRDLLGAFEYMCALCLDLNARDSRFHERFF